MMQMSDDDWYDRTAAMLIGSDPPEAFVEDCLTKSGTDPRNGT